MKLPPVMIKLTLNSLFLAVNEPIFIAPEDIVTYRPAMVRDLTRRDAGLVDGAVLTLRTHAYNPQSDSGSIYVLEPVEEVALLIGKAFDYARIAVSPNHDIFPGYKNQPWVEGPDQHWINQVRETRNGINEMELYGEGEPPFSYTEVRDAMIKATVERDTPSAGPNNRFNSFYGGAVLTLMQEVRAKRYEREAPLRQLRDLAGGMPSEPHGVKPTRQPEGAGRD